MLVNLHFAVALFFMSVFIKVFLYFNKEVLSSLTIPLKDTLKKKRHLLSLSYFHPIISFLNKERQRLA